MILYKGCAVGLSLLVGIVHARASRFTRENSRLWLDVVEAVSHAGTLAGCVFFGLAVNAILSNRYLGFDSRIFFADSVQFCSNGTYTGPVTALQCKSFASTKDARAIENNDSFNINTFDHWLPDWESSRLRQIFCDAPSLAGYSVADQSICGLAQVLSDMPG